MDVVVNVLAGDDWGDAGGVLALDALADVAELSLLGSQATLDVLGLTVVERAVLDWNDVVVVLLTHLLDILDGLHGGVVVVLVHLLVNGGADLLVLSAVDGLMSDGWGNLLVDGGVMVTRLVHEVGDSCLCGVHDVGFFVRCV